MENPKVDYYDANIMNELYPFIRDWGYVKILQIMAEMMRIERERGNEQFRTTSAESVLKRAAESFRSWGIQ